MKKFTVQEAVEAIEKGLVGKSPPSLKNFIYERNLDIEEDLDTFFEKVSEAVTRRTEERVRAFFQSLGVPFPPEVGERLREGGWVRLQHSGSEAGLSGELEVTTGGAGKSEEKLSVPFFGWDVGRFDFHTLRGIVEFRTSSGLQIVRGSAYLRAFSQRDVESTLNAARGLRSFLVVMDLPDLEGAIEALAELAPGESRIEGDYVLARNESWLLRRGLVFGDPVLDKAFLLGEPITLSFPGDVEISFRATWEARVVIEDLRIRWGEEEVAFRDVYFQASVFVDDPAMRAIREGLRLEFRSLEGGRSLLQRDREATDIYSPKMWAFLKAFAHHEDPFGALAEGRFHAHVTGELFLGL